MMITHNEPEKNVNRAIFAKMRILAKALIDITITLENDTPFENEIARIEIARIKNQLKSEFGFQTREK